MLQYLCMFRIQDASVCTPKSEIIVDSMTLVIIYRRREIAVGPPTAGTDRGATRAPDFRQVHP